MNTVPTPPAENNAFAMWLEDLARIYADSLGAGNPEGEEWSQWLGTHLMGLADKARALHARDPITFEDRAEVQERALRKAAAFDQWVDEVHGNLTRNEQADPRQPRTPRIPQL